ncbi:MAG: hypothetical protein QG638_2874, partial [Pseudomonadota bacterium]|nr:hypothetical protein [Pseudomonadota bacterium]
GQQAGQEGFRDFMFLCVHCGSGQFGSFPPVVRLHKILHTLFGDAQGVEKFHR